MSTKEPLPNDWREYRRLRAWQLKQQGWKQKDIAAALGVTEGAVSQWLKKARVDGAEALRHQPPPGPQPRLSAEQLAQLPDLLSKGAEHYGFRGAVWTTARVAILIKRQFGVSYHPAHCSRLLRAIKYSVQKPEEQATQRDEQAIANWKEERWPALKKKAEQEKRQILFVDESGFYLLPLAVRTYAPVGKTPVLRVPLTRDHISAIGALTPQGKLFMHTQNHSYKGEDVVRFLKQLLRQIPGKLLIIWDGSPIHRCQAVKDFLAQGAAARIHLERLPAYAPEFNPQEGVWNLLKRRELKNVCCKSLPELENALLLARARLRHRKQALRHCFVHAGYPL